MSQEITKEFVKDLAKALEEGKPGDFRSYLEEAHPADLAEILQQLDREEGEQLLDFIPDATEAEVLMELDAELRSKFLETRTRLHIAVNLVEHLDSDDAADLLNELPEDRMKEVLASLKDQEQARELAKLLVYPEDTAGALMGTELIKVNHNWKVLQCVKEMRKQAEDIDQVHAIYVVDDRNKLLGTLSLKKLLTSSTQTPIAEVYEKRAISIEATQDAELAARDMQKYDLIVMPVVDALGHLLGRITIDDVVDYIREEAREDYNLASGITDEVSGDEGVWRLTRARLPWLLIALCGGLLAASILGRFETQLHNLPKMAFFMPLIAAMGGNVGVQSSAIIVQGLANQSLMGSSLQRLIKEISVALLNGFVLGGLIIGLGLIMGFSLFLCLTVASALLAVVLVAALIGTFVPLILNHYSIDPALATGPFITTLNDITGLFIYFSIGKILLGG